MAGRALNVVDAAPSAAGPSGLTPAAVLSASGVLFLAEHTKHGRRWVMPMRLPQARQAGQPTVEIDPPAWCIETV